ncbi:transglutaminase domain-containing protein [Bifidobacterium platyrrhinorum]|uniref:Transglutaminase-like domain-containing protein n=1 Tax=Bifidobacterium platyrrhinorum TaxID=2661628 RepID=A0A6L9SVE0_9BIFI|nr:transglutaminase family protein [Bifidobacterium platyrrhinorum]NEG56025.1 hypothetical protein [Bifidobacterium platyrrhinorum]
MLVAVLAVIAIAVGGLVVAYRSSPHTNSDGTVSGTALPAADQVYAGFDKSKYDLREPIAVDNYYEFSIRLEKPASVKSDPYEGFALKGAEMSVDDSAKVYQDAALTIPVPSMSSANPSVTGSGNGTVDLGGSQDIPKYMRHGDSIGAEHGFLPSDGYYYVQYMGGNGKRLAKPAVRFFTVVDAESGTGDSQLAAVGNVSATVNGQGGVDISWDKVEGAKSYDVYTYIVRPQVGEPGDDRYSREQGLVKRIGSSTKTELLSKDYDKVRKYRVSDTAGASTWSQNEAYRSLMVENQDSIDGCLNSTSESCADIMQAAGGSWDPDSAGRLYFVVTAVDADGHEGRWHATDATGIVPSIPLKVADIAQFNQRYYNLKGVFGEDNTAEEDMQAYVYTFVTMANGATVPIPSKFGEPRRTGGNGGDSWTFTYSAPGTKIENTGRLYYEGDLNAALPTITKAAIEALPKAGGLLDRMNAVHGDVDWTGYDKKKIDSDNAKSQYFTYASNDYGTYLANNILNGHEVIDITKYASDDYQTGTSDVLDEVIYQNPYIKTDSKGVAYTVRKSGDRTVLWVRYPDDYRDRQKQLADFVSQASGSFQGSDRDKAVAIDRFLSSRMTYDYDAFAAVDYGSANAFGSTKAVASYPDAWSALGAVNGKGVCMSYAYAYQALAKAAGLDTRVVTGSVSGTKAGHAWNYVKIDGAWLLIDPTWDDAGDTADDRYQLKDKSQVTDHFADKDGWTLASQVGQY